ncbi:hypothetical protein HYPGJ_20162 [Hyphomicrobium sp. GJ21]|nr:hypothetical protein HYPGJ_20162 [Hyphomicrobium sp. GJ21]
MAESRSGHRSPWTGARKEGKLVRVLEAWCPPTTGFHLYYPSRRNLSFAMRTFLDFLREKRAD